jgi:Cu2+-exporting ATPase
MLQDWFGFEMPGFTGAQWVGPLFAIAIFFYGGVPFLQMARPEIRHRQPGMMTLISLAITVAFVYSLFALLTEPESGFFWEMATLIDIMLLGHWLEMRSVRQASGALNELAKLMPDEAELVTSDGNTKKISEIKNSLGYLQSHNFFDFISLLDGIHYFLVFRTDYLSENGVFFL